jgi:hypothetical protein
MHRARITGGHPLILKRFVAMDSLSELPSTLCASSDGEESDGSTEPIFFQLKTVGTSDEAEDCASWTLYHGRSGTYDERPGACGPRCACLDCQPCCTGVRHP